MKRLFPIIFMAIVGIAVSGTLASTAALAAELKRSIVTVENDRITIGDIFEQAGETTGTPVLRAPKPGQRVTLKTAELSRLARSNGIDWAPVLGDEKLVIERASYAMGRDEITWHLAQALSDAGFNADGQFEIELSNRSLVLHIATGTLPTLAIDDLLVDERTLRFTATVSAPVGDPDAERVRISGRAHRTEQIPVVVRRINAGELISKDDVAWRQIRSERLHGDVIMGLDRLIGMAARRSLRPDLPIRRGDVARPILVSKGTAVTMIYRTPGLTLTTVGRATQDGTANDSIRVMNMQSKTTVQAVVTDRGTVTVSPPLLLGMNSGASQ